MALVGISFGLICVGRINEVEKYLPKTIELGEIYYSNMILGHVYLCRNEKEKALDCYKKSLDARDNKQPFWEDMADDFQHLTQYGITEAYYQSVLAELKNKSTPSV